MTENDHKQRAIKWLKILRSGTGQYNKFICLLHKEIRKGGLSFADIGTSREELLEFKNKGREIDARKLMGFLRSDLKRSDFFTERINKIRIKGNFSFEDIGTSREEFSSFF